MFDRYSSDYTARGRLRTVAKHPYDENEGFKTGKDVWFEMRGPAAAQVALDQAAEHEMTRDLRQFLFEHCFAPWAGAETGSLCFALTYLLVWMLPTAELHRRRLYLRV